MSMVNASNGIVERCRCVVGCNVEIDRSNVKCMIMRCEMCGWLGVWGSGSFAPMTWVATCTALLVVIIDNGDMKAMN
jgi:hypothetical protein